MNIFQLALTLLKTNVYSQIGRLLRCHPYRGIRVPPSFQFLNTCEFLSGNKYLVFLFIFS